MKRSPYVRKRPDSNQYWFRMAIPADVLPRCQDLRHRAGSELTFSLHTDSLARANTLASALGEEYRLIFAYERTFVGAPRPLGSAEIGEIREFMRFEAAHEFLRIDEDLRRRKFEGCDGLRSEVLGKVMGERWREGPPGPDRAAGDYHALIDQAVAGLARTRHAVQIRSFEFLLDWALERTNVAVAKDSEQYQVGLLVVQEGFLEICRQIQLRCCGVQVPTPGADIHPTLELVEQAGMCGASAIPPMHGISGLTIPSAPLWPTPIAQAASARAADTNGAPHAATDGFYPSTEELLKEWKDRKRDRNPKTLREVRARLEDYAAFARKQKRSMFEKRTVAEFKKELRREHSDATVKKAIGLLRTVFQSAVDVDMLDKNVFAGAGKDLDVPVKSPREDFSPEDICRIFSQPLFMQKALPKGKQAGGWAAYWIPLIMYLMGTREEEVAQLTAEDVCWTKGLHPIPYLSFRHDLKHDVSERDVPIHPKLLELGFMECVPKKGRLFPVLKPDRDGKLTSGFSKWFHRFLRGRYVGITDPNKVLYSFRHTFITAFRNSPIHSSDLERAFVGHAPSGNDVHQHYGQPISVENMLACLKRVNLFEGFPL